VRDGHDHLEDGPGRVGAAVGTVSRFEDLAAWQRGRELVRLVHRVSATGDMAREPVLRDQMRRAAVSVISNIAEGFERGGDNGVSAVPGPGQGLRG
jgi:hypothetical protein